MKLLLRLGLSLFFVIEVTGRACDLCGCYTPQLQARPGMNVPPPFHF